MAQYFRELGAYIIDADRIGHEVIAPGNPAYHEIIAQFGKGVADANHSIDRTKLGPLVFADAQKLQTLNAIVHPRIIARVRELTANQFRRNPHAVVIVDAALIYEAGLGGSLRKVIVVWCRPEQQVDRLMAKTGVSRDEAERRIKSQMPADEKRRRAAYVIDCSGTLEQSRAQAESIYQELQRLAGEAP